MLADKLFKLPSFQRQFDAILTISAAQSINDLQWQIEKQTLLNIIDWNNVLSIGSVLSYSTDHQHLDAALRIAQTCLTTISTDGIQRNAATILLDNLTNNLAIKLALDRQYIQSTYEENYPFSFKLQSIHSRLENSVLINGHVVNLNKFQRAVFDAYQQNDIISISAPTSSGKSFILCNIILQELVQGKKNIAYVVPTRALISQVETDIRELIQKNELSDVNVSTVPQWDPGLSLQSNVFVFTQERLHWFLIDNADVSIDAIFVDEAQKIEDGNRGILLQQKIEDVIDRNPGVKVYFSSPFTENPEILYENINVQGRSDKVNTQFVSVNQNLIYLRQRPRIPQQWEATLILANKELSLGSLKLKDRPTSEIKKVVYICHAFSDTGNLIYTNGAAEAEKTALVLFDLLDPGVVSHSVIELIKLVRQTIHREYALAKVLAKGIAFHYGNMPLLIRQEIEALFKAGDIKYLVCTSTLLEGVNLPAKNIFIRKPTRGRNKPLNPNDFWNLAGRAGRWGKEFSGNIVCIEPSSWNIPPSPNKSKQRIQRATDRIQREGKEMIDYITADTPREVANTRQDLEFGFGYYYTRYLEGKLPDNNAFFNQLGNLFQELQPRIQVPEYIIRRNPGISPIAQQELLDFFNDKSGEIEELVPVYPEDDNAVKDYIQLVGRIGKTLSAYPAALNHARAILLTNWMSGKPLSYLISTTYNWYQSKDKYKNVKKLPLVIREVMDDVENFVRFRFAKDSSCYVDILRYYLELHQHQALLGQIPQLSLWLEFGVSQKTHLSLLSLGLTRNTVIELSQFITNSQMDKDECLRWLNAQDINQFSFSPIINADIAKLITSADTSDNAKSQ